MTNPPQTNWSFCPSCQGSGRVGGGRCTVCRGMGVALVLRAATNNAGVTNNDSLVYFDLPLTRTAIYLRKLKKSAFVLLDLLSLAFAVTGLICLGWWLTHSNDVDVAKALWNLPKSQHALLFVWWLSTVVDGFLIYRYSRRANAYNRFKSSDWLLSGVEMGSGVDWAGAEAAKRRINVADYLSEQALECLEQAYVAAVKNKDTVEPMHLFTALLGKSAQVNNWLNRLEVDNESLLAKIARHVAEFPIAETAGEYSSGLKQVALGAWLNAAMESRRNIQPMDMLLGVYESDQALADILFDVEIDKNKLVNLVEWYNINERILFNLKKFAQLARFKPGTGMDRAYTALATPLLDSIGVDLTVSAKFGHLPICVARDKELNDILTALASGQPGILLVGPVGVGKHALIEGLAQQMVMEKVPVAFQDKRLIEVDVARLLGGAAGAQAEQRMMEIINEVGQAGNCILYFPDIENMLGLTAGGESSLDLAEILVSALEQGQIYCVASVSDEAYRKYVERSVIAKTMSVIKVEEPNTDAAIQMLESKVAWLENQFGVYFSYESLAKSVELASRFDHASYLPEKALKMLEHVAPKTKQVKGAQVMITADDVATFVSQELKVPVNKVSREEGKELLNLEATMHERMIGQEEAVSMVAESLRRSRAELREGKRPIASFIFLGPTGVGKTELAKTLAATYFGDEKAMIRLDMSEYQADDAVVKMIGSTDGTLGYLTERVRTMPFSLVLLDEIEKANAGVLDLFLQVMDDGRLTDGQGRTIDFTNSIIISTSNIGAVAIKQAVEKGMAIETIKQNLLDNELVKYLRPEFINRFDGVVVFRPLSLADVTKIAALLIKELAKLMEAKGIILEADPRGLEILAKAGYHPEFGARPLRRLLQDRIENVIAKMILSGEVGRRDHLIIDSKAELVVQKARKL